MAQEEITVVSATITAGESLSSIIDCNHKTILAILMPQEWTPANLSVQISPDGETFYDLFGEHGGEVSINVTPGTAVTGLAHLPVIMLRFRSGMRAAPVIQEAERTFSIMLF